MNRDKKTIMIAGTSIERGESKLLSITMPELYDCTPMSMPVHVIRGKKSGPCLVITAAIHGDELNGIEISRRLIRKTKKKLISGSLIVIPIVNVYGFLYQDRYLMDRRDLNRSFPGSTKGSLASRLARVISKEIVSQATHLIDLHAGSNHRSNLPQIRTNLDSVNNRNLAKAFNTPVLLHSAIREGSLRAYAESQKVPCMIYEAGEASRFDELAINTGVKGIMNVMQKLNMLSESKQVQIKHKSHISKHAYWVRAPESGLFLPKKSLGKEVIEGELLAKIGNPTTTKEIKLLSPISGIIIGRNNLPNIHEGAALFNIATFNQAQPVAKNIAAWEDYFSESYDD